jgi:hypothetical protein
MSKYDRKIILSDDPLYNEALLSKWNLAPGNDECEVIDYNNTRNIIEGLASNSSNPLICIVGHGLSGSNSIQLESGEILSAEELAELLHNGPSFSNSYPNKLNARLKISLIVCEAGSSRNIDMLDCFAGKLHIALEEKGIYADISARTSIVVINPNGEKRTLPIGKEMEYENFANLNEQAFELLEMSDIKGAFHIHQQLEDWKKVKQPGSKFIFMYDEHHRRIIKDAYTGYVYDPNNINDCELYAEKRAVLELINRYEEKYLSKRDMDFKKESFFRYIKSNLIKSEYVNYSLLIEDIEKAVDKIVNFGKFNLCLFGGNIKMGSYFHELMTDLVEKLSSREQLRSNVPDLVSRRS